MRLLVFGCEHSGTRWLTHLLSLHPDVDSVLHRSCPHGGQIPTSDLVSDLKSRHFDGVALMFRDQSCCLAAQETGGSFEAAVESSRRSLQEQERPTSTTDPFLQSSLISTWVNSAAAVFDACRTEQIAVTLVSYEMLVQARSLALQQALNLLGLDSARYDFYEQDHPDRSQFIEWDARLSSATVDGNRKYVPLNIREVASSMNRILRGRTSRQLSKMKLCFRSAVKNRVFQD